MPNANTHPALKSWISVPADHQFPIQNLPYGIFSTADLSPRVGVAIGDYVLDLHEVAMLDLLDPMKGLPAREVFAQPSLNAFMSLGPAIWSATRGAISSLLSTQNTTLQHNQSLRDKVLLPQAKVQMHLPIQIGDYTDFYSSMQHATNVGIMFRDPANALLPNWKHIPVGYHGRASSVVVSGTNLHRPQGQLKAPADTAPKFGPSRKLDFELEMAWVVGVGNPLGHPIKADDWRDHVFGFCIFNDWSARDIQSWEYVPLGPFLGKNFGSSLSPWVVTAEALTPFLIEGQTQDPEVLPYLQTNGPTHLDIELEVWLQPAGGQAHKISQSNYKHLYWSVAQQLAHHTVNGCNMRPGDLCASGTISGPERSSWGSLLELSWNGAEPLTLPDGSTRTFLEDGDTIIMKAYQDLNGIRMGFGEVRGTILPAVS